MDAHVQPNSPPQRSFSMFTLAFLFFASPLPFQRTTFVKGSLLIMKKWPTDRYPLSVIIVSMSSNLHWWRRSMFIFFGCKTCQIFLLACLLQRWQFVNIVLGHALTFWPIYKSWQDAASVEFQFAAETVPGQFTYAFHHYSPGFSQPVLDVILHSSILPDDAAQV